MILLKLKVWHGTHVVHGFAASGSCTSFVNTVTIPDLKDDANYIGT